MGWRKHPKNLPPCAGKLNSLLFFRIHRSASFFSKCFNFKLNTMQIFNFGQKSLKLASDHGLASSCFCRYRSNVYVHEWLLVCLFICLFICYGHLFITNLDICVPCFCFEHKNLCIFNVCTAIFRSFGKKLRSAEDNHCRLNL